MFDELFFRKGSNFTYRNEILKLSPPINRKERSPCGAGIKKTSELGRLIPEKGPSSQEGHAGTMSGGPRQTGSSVPNPHSQRGPWR